MNKGKQNNHTIINHLLKDKIPFAAWRIPGEKVFHIISQSHGQVTTLRHISELNNRQGFVIAPFATSEQHPIVVIEPSYPRDILTLYNNETPTREMIAQVASVPIEPHKCDDNYAQRFTVFTNALKAGDFDKLVLSRTIDIDLKADLSCVDTFYNACRLYPFSYTYLYYTPVTGIWIGSTPEILLSGMHDKWQTVALAGTMPLRNGQPPLDWSKKNQLEQAYVADYIRERLLTMGITSESNGPYPVRAGALAHIKTEFHFTFQAPSCVGTLLQMLHPTPAVCGLPKDEAYHFILDHEEYDRSYYSGFVGWLDPHDKTDIYVNLRCMHITENSATLYAGGGLLSSSELNDEWQESENKLETMKRILT